MPYLTPPRIKLCERSPAFLQPDGGAIPCVRAVRAADWVLAGGLVKK